VLADRGIRVCLLAAVLLGFVNEWWWSSDARVFDGSGAGDHVYWFSRVIWTAPYALALVAVLRSARPGAGVLVAGVALVAGLVAVALHQGVGLSLHGLLAYLVDVMALLPADVMVAARRRLDAVAGAAAGLACGAVLGLVAFLWILPYVDLPAWYVLGGIVFPPVALTIVGLAAGALPAPGRGPEGAVSGWPTAGDATS
jgi:hypothetical protein